MTYTNKNNIELNSQEAKGSNLQIDCKNCFGFCCVALYFSTCDGFPEDKEANKPCKNLQEDFKCKVHNNLREIGLKGCTAYDCFGAGQKVAQITYAGEDWRKAPESAKEMFDVFLIMRQLHEMLWYLTEALEHQKHGNLEKELKVIINETEKLAEFSAEKLKKLDLVAHRVAVNALLKENSELVRNKVTGKKKQNQRDKKTFRGGLGLIGADLRKKDLKGENLSGACLIAANLRAVDLTGTDLIGADLRDTDLRAADLSQSIYVTQAQINTAKGDSSTKLPRRITRPTHW